MCLCNNKIMLCDFAIFWKYRFFGIDTRRNMISFDAIVGSHMWGMNHKNSDKDIARIYLASLKDVLLGKNLKKGIEVEGKPNEDIVKYEVSHLLDQLKRGNINFLWIATTECVEFPRNHPFCIWLHNIIHQYARNNLAKNYRGAIWGLTRQNLLKYFNVKLCENGDIKHLTEEELKNRKDRSDMPEWKVKKKLSLIARTLRFGTHLMNNKIKYESVYAETLSDVSTEAKNFLASYENSTLPEEPNKEELDDLLLRVRALQIEIFNEMMK